MLYGTICRSFNQILKYSEVDRVKPILLISQFTQIKCHVLRVMYDNIDSIMVFSTHSEFYGQGKNKLIKSKFYNENSSALISEYGKYRIYDKDNFYLCSELFTSSILLFNDNFEKVYHNFLQQNQKKILSITRNLTYSSPNLVPFLFHLTNGKVSHVLWILRNMYKERNLNITPYQEILFFIQNNKQCEKQLTKGSIVSYNGEKEISSLINEIREIKYLTKANSAANSFNTAQKKILKNNLNNKTLVDLLCRFGHLTKIQRHNFIRKMSTITEIEELIRQLNFVTSASFNWNKKSLIEYIQNVPKVDCEIVVDKGNLLLVKVNDFETIKRLGKNTNWCISKNRYYWRNYINDNTNSNQYVLFDFSKKSDDEYSIVGITINNDKGISHSHSFTNLDLTHLPYDRNKCGNKFGLEPKYIGDLLDEHNINVYSLMNPMPLHYQWDKKNFLKKLKSGKGVFGRYEILKDEDNQLVLSVSDFQIDKILIKDYSGMTPDENNTFIIFADFNIQDNNPEKLIFGTIHFDSYRQEESISMIRNFFGVKSKYTLQECLSIFNMDNDILCRPNIDFTRLRDAIVSFDFPVISSILLSHKNDKSFLEDIKHCGLFSEMSDMICLPYSYDMLNVIYDSGIKLTDVMNNIAIYDILEELVSQSYWKDVKHICSDSEFKALLKKPNNNYINIGLGYSYGVKLIIEHENNAMISDELMNYVLSNLANSNPLKGEYVKLLLPYIPYTDYIWDALANFADSQDIDIELSSEIHRLNSLARANNLENAEVCQLN